MAQSQYVQRRSTDERSTQELFSDMTREAGVLLRKEIELAKIETKAQLSEASKVGVAFTVAGVAGYLALLLLSFAAAWGLAAVLPAGVAFLIVGLVYAVVAAVLLAQARKKAAALQLAPQQTIETLREDGQWARAQTK